MTRVTRKGFILLKIFVIVFFMNATLGYSACCTGMDGVGGVDSTQSEAKMPCHDSDEDAPAELEKCCSACLTIVPPPEHVISAVGLADTGVPFALLIFIPRNIAPPYRPPIALLS